MDSNFINELKNNELKDIMQKYLIPAVMKQLDVKILGGCQYYDLIRYARERVIIDLPVQNLVGQIGQFSDCGGGYCCGGNSNGRSNSTWLSAINHSCFLENLRLLKDNPEFYFSKMTKPLEFFTLDNINYYSTGCSKVAIIAKIILTIHAQYFGENIMLKDVVVYRPIPVSNIEALDLSMFQKIKKFIIG